MEVSFQSMFISLTAPSLPQAVRGSSALLHMGMVRSLGVNDEKPAVGTVFLERGEGGHLWVLEMGGVVDVWGTTKTDRFHVALRTWLPFWPHESFEKPGKHC